MQISPELRRLLIRGGSLLLILLPVLPYAMMFGGRAAGLGFDLHVFWEAARAVGHARSPYRPAAIAHVRVLEARHMTAEPLAAWAVYPPALFAVLIPFGWLPWHVAFVFGTLLLALAPFYALRSMGVRDWRCYMAMYASLPVVSSIGLGAISTALMLGLALIWRQRSTEAAAIAALVAKLFLWPLMLTLGGIDGHRRAAVVAIGAAAVTVGSWAVIDFADITRYPQLLSDLSAIEAHNSFSTTGIAYALGLPLALGTVLGVVLGGVSIALSVHEGRAGRRDAAFTYGLLAALLLSPIVWMHYLALLPVAIAARFPRFGIVWLVPLVLWAHQLQAASGSVFALALFWGCVLTVTVVTVRASGGTNPLVVAVDRELALRSYLRWRALSPDRPRA
jgi:hypothetical protein